MKRISNFTLRFFLFLSIASCKDKTWKFHTYKTLDTHLIPSGSGLSIYHDTILLVGDDADFIIKLPANGKPHVRVGLYPDAPTTRIDRDIKHDLESSAIGTIGKETYLFTFGSGAVSPYRDTLFAIHLADSTRTFSRSLLPLYNAIRAKTGLKENELNIEGTALSGNKLFLFNRGKNLIVTIPWDKFILYIQEKGRVAIPPFTISPVSLPEIDGFSVGFSGACVLDENELLFTASLEETTDFTKDGQIRGSYIGILRLHKDGTITLQSLHDLLNIGDKGEPVKLESIDVIGNNETGIELVTVADNDDGRSKLFFIKMRRG